MLENLSRREFVALGSASCLGVSFLNFMPSTDQPRSLETPYKLGRLVLTASARSGEYDAISVDCPFVFRHEGNWFMTFVSYDGIGYQTGLASSNDLVNWKKEGCILRRDPNSGYLKYNVALTWILRENQIGSPGNLIKFDGKYIGAYHAYPSQGLEQGSAVIGIATSEDLRHWTIEAPILRAEEGAAWEQGGLYKGCILRNDGMFYLFYNAKNHTEGEWHEQTGVAFSKDLKTWQRFYGNPVIINGPAGSVDEKFASDPCVLKNGNQWAFFYFGLDAAGVARDLVATGIDLFHATKALKPVIDVGKPGSIDATYAHKPSVISYRGDLYHFYCAVSHIDGHEVRGISVARSRPW